MAKMENDANWLVIRIPRMYADKVRELSLGRIVGEAIRIQDECYGHEPSETLRDDIYANGEELQHIKNAVDAFSSAVREGLMLEQQDRESKA